MYFTCPSSLATAVPLSPHTPWVECRRRKRRPQSVLTPAARQIDLVRVTNGKTFYMVNAATGGFGGMVSTDVTSEDKRRWGPMAYWLTAFSKLSELRESRVRLELDAETTDMTTYGLAIANGKFVGGGFPVAPDAELDDGLLDISVVPILPTLELLACGVDFMLGRYNRVRTMKSSRVRVIVEPKLTYSFDGEAIRGVDATFEVVPKALRIV